jgi:PAS domain S-box-containing protein
MTSEQPRFDALLVSKQAVMAATDGDIDAIFRAVVQKSLSCIPSADGALVEIREQDDLVLRAASGDGVRRIGQRRAYERTFAGRCMRSGQPMICDDVEAETAIDMEGYRQAGMRSLLSVPIVHRKRSLGVLKFFSKRPRAFERKDLTIAQLVGAQIVSGLMAVAEQSAIKAQLESDARFEAITETLPQMIWTMSRVGRPQYCNRRALSFLGVSSARSLRSNPFSFILPEDRDEVIAFWREAKRNPALRDIECRVKPRTGPARWMQLHLVPVYDDRGRLTEWIGAGVDIDDLKSMELNLKDAIRTRDLLLQEVNHRVKNSLQMVVGLLALQASKIANKEARQRLMEAREQVATIAQVHQSIYRTGDHDHVEFRSLAHSVVMGLVGEGPTRRADVSFDMPHDVVLPLDHGVPLALVVAEIVTNSIKHGRPPESDCKIVIASHRERGQMVIDISDDGPGLPDQVSLDSSAGLGMEIIFGLTNQAGGRVEIVRTSPGAHFRLVLPFN